MTAPKIKQAMILAAGEGTRMRPLTLYTPKPLLEVGGKPLIVWHIDKLIKAGVTDIVINACYLAQKMVDYFKTHTFDVNIHLSLETHFSEPLETAGGIALALERQLLKNEPFMLINGDVWTDFEFLRLANIDFDASNAWRIKGHLCLIDNPPHNPEGDFWLSSDGCLGEQGEKLTFAGVSVLSPALFCDTPIGKKAPLAPVLRTAINERQLTGEKLSSNWVDVGTPERLNELNNFIITH